MYIALILFGIFCVEVSGVVSQIGIGTVTVVVFWVLFFAGFVFSLWGLFGILKEKRKEKQ